MTEVFRPLRLHLIFVALAIALTGVLLYPARSGEVLPRHAPRPAIPKTDSSGRIIRGPRGQFASANWSGYVLANWQTGGTYSSASATWTVPTVSSPPGGAYSATWVGIGGAFTDSSGSSADGSLIQLGTEQDSKFSRYYAWYALSPSYSEQSIPLTVGPGDSISASLAETSTNSWTLKMTVTHKGTPNTWTRSPINFTSSHLSAEWIMEAPTVAGSIASLADYHQATFSATSLPLQSGDEEYIMYDPHAQTSNPSAASRVAPASAPAGERAR